MNNPDAYNQQNLLLRLFYDRNYSLFEEKLVLFQVTDEYQELDTQDQFDLEYCLLLTFFRQQRYQECWDKLAQLEKPTLFEKFPHLSVKFKTFKAELLMKQNRAEEAMQLFEQTLDEVTDSDTYFDFSYRWEQALGELEVQYQKQGLLAAMKKRWAEIQQLMSKNKTNNG